MDNRSIGVFDSGIGGLAVLFRLQKAFPEEDFVYLGDNANVPYGSKKENEIQELIKSNLNILNSAGVKAVVIACNTASLCFNFDEFNNLPIFRLRPDLSLQRLKKERGTFIATPYTVNKIKGALTDEIMKNITFIKQSSLALNIEKAVLARTNCVPVDHQESDSIEGGYLYLGCTHYLFLKNKLKSIFNANKIYDGIDELINIMSEKLENRGIFAQNIQTIDFVGSHSEINRSAYYWLLKNGGQLM